MWAYDRRLPGLTRHLLTRTELDRDELRTLLHRADALKAAPLSSRALEGQSVALIFEKHSTRTRLSFEAGVFELGGQPVVLRPAELQLSRGESAGATARGVRQPRGAEGRLRRRRQQRRALARAHRRDRGRRGRGRLARGVHADR